MNTAIYSFIKKHALIQYGDTIIIGLSGGPDSVFLLHMLNELRTPLSLTLIAAHLNHGWRSDAHEDVIFCKKLCADLTITFESACAAEIPVSIPKKGSLEQEGRILRRTYFESIKTKYNGTSIALGQHKDDQIETFFIRLIRGASLEGLASMRPSHNGYIRPLLETSKQDILTYLSKKNLAYRIDSTNDSPLFLRNRIRTILPLLSDCDTRFSVNTLKALQHIQNVHNEMQFIIKKKYLQIVYIEYLKYILDVFLLHKETPYYQKEIVALWLKDEKIHSLSTISDTFLDEILRFLLTPRGGTHQLHPAWKIVKKSNKAIIEKN